MKIIVNILTVIAILFFVWFGISYFEVISQNLDCNNPTILSSWNLFSLLIQCFPFGKKSENFFGFLLIVRRITSKYSQNKKIFINFFEKGVDFFLKYVIL